MTDLLARWRRSVDRAAAELADVPDREARRRPALGKWSPKEIVGHLVDSASHNHRRFVEAHGRADLVFPGYQQDVWVQTQRYQAADWPDLVRLWSAFNHHLIRVVAEMPAEALSMPRAVHNLDELAWRPVSRAEPVTLGWFVEDYVGHMEHHLAQVRQRLGT
jgi:hypothetical protein